MRTTSASPAPPSAAHPAFNETNVNDKPARIAGLPSLGHQEDALRRCRPLHDGDDAGGRPRGSRRSTQAIQRAGVAENTVVIFLSDNGYFRGHHRIYKGKAKPYDEAAKIPFVWRVPNTINGYPSAPRLYENVGTIDIAPTIVEMAGVTPCNVWGECRVMDGRSLAGLLRGDETTWPANRPLLFSLGHGCGTFRALRTINYLYSEWMAAYGAGCYAAERELYDSSFDPFQMRNLLYGPSAVWGEPIAAQLAPLLQQIATCAGRTGPNPCP